MKKRILSLLMALVLIVTCIAPINASAAALTQKKAVESLLRWARFTQSDANTVGGWVELAYYVDLVLDTDNFDPDATCSSVYYNTLRTRANVLYRQNRTSKIPVYPIVKVDAQPNGAAVELGGEITLTTSASISNGTEAAYQWYSCADADKTAAAVIEGATSGTLTVTPAEVGAFYYFCRFSAKTAANVVDLDSDVVCVTVTEPAASIVISTQPKDLAVFIGDEAQLTVDASGSDGSDVSYQWYVCSDADKTDAADIEGATTAVFTVPTEKYGDFYYFCRVSAENGESVDSAVATILISLVYTYYSTWDSAVADANNGTIGENADAEKENAVACIYLDNNNVANAVLLQDTVTAGVETSTDIVINLNGHKLSMANGNLSSAIRHTNGHLVVDGSKTGSIIEATNSEKNTQCINVRGGSLTVNGGTYIARAGAAKKEARTIQIYPDLKATLTDCDIFAYGAENGLVGGVFNYGTATLTNCRVEAYGEYNSSNNKRPEGIYSDGPLTLNNCYAYGAHSAVHVSDTTVINGGTYESPGHGGIYVFCTNKTVHIRNATVRYCDIKAGDTYIAGAIGPGMYIGGGSGKDYITVYMDNCVISSKEGEPQIVLRGTSDEHDNNLYISNSTLLGEKFYIRIDNLTHKLYLGAGNNFNTENTTIKALYDPNSMLPCVIETDEIYDTIY